MPQLNKNNNWQVNSLNLITYQLLLSEYVKDKVFVSPLPVYAAHVKQNSHKLLQFLLKIYSRMFDKNVTTGNIYR